MAYSGEIDRKTGERTPYYQLIFKSFCQFREVEYEIIQEKNQLKIKFIKYQFIIKNNVFKSNYNMHNSYTILPLFLYIVNDLLEKNIIEYIEIKDKYITILDREYCKDFIIEQGINVNKQDEVYILSKS
jgi:hypothetical protein